MRIYLTFISLPSRREASVLADNEQLPTLFLFTKMLMDFSAKRRRQSFDKACEKITRFVALLIWLK
jgi:hypothetical protein